MYRGSHFFHSTPAPCGEHEPSSSQNCIEIIDITSDDDTEVIYISSDDDHSIICSEESTSSDDDRLIICSGESDQEQDVSPTVFNQSSLLTLPKEREKNAAMGATSHVDICARDYNEDDLSTGEVSLILY